MKFVLYGYAISLMLGGTWRHFWGQYSEILRLGDNFWRKKNVLEISSPEYVRPIGSEALQNILETLAKL